MIRLGSKVTVPSSVTIGDSPIVQSTAPNCFFSLETWNTRRKSEFGGNSRR